MRRLTLPSTLLVLLTASCGDPRTNDPQTEFEGDAAGECDDAADNDQDGLFDCDDDDCAGSPACELNECTEAAIRILDRLDACGQLSDTTDTTDTTPDEDSACTPTDAAELACMAACYDNAECGAFDGTDMASGLAFADCLGICLEDDLDTTPAEDSAVDTSGGNHLAGFSNVAFFGYDPEADVARSYVASSTGDTIQPGITFFFFNDDYRDSQDESDGCTLRLSIDGTIPRASWAGAGSGYLFGFEINPDDATVESNCDDFFGPGASDDLYQDFISTGHWGVGLSTALSAATFDALENGGADPGDYIGGVFYSDSDSLPSSTWPTYSSVYEVNAAFEIQTERGLPATIPGADADQPRSNPSIPTTTTPIAAVYAVDTFTLFLF